MNWAELIGGSAACMIGLLVPFLLVLGLAIFGVIRSADQRVRDLGGLASELGFTFVPRRHRRFAEDHRELLIFGLGADPQVRNSISGRARLGGHDVLMVMGDLHFKAISGSASDRNRRARSLSFAVARLPWGGMPETMLRRETLVDRIGGLVGLQDIDFESEAFSRRFHVTSQDPRFAHALVDPGMLTFLLENEPPSIEIEGDVVCIFGHRPWSNEEFRSALDWMGRFMGHWPAHLIEQHRRPSA